MSFLLDTVTLSETHSPRPDRGVRAWLDLQPWSLVYTSVICIGEIQSGIARQSGDRRQLLQGWLDDLRQELGNRALPVTDEVAVHWGGITGQLARAGIAVPILDSLIAATALVHDLTVVTRNVADFERCGVPVLNPWTGAG